MSKSTTNPAVPPVLIESGGLNMRFTVSNAVPLENEVQLVVTVVLQVDMVTGAGGLDVVSR
jgi:hypothetical protein